MAGAERTEARARSHVTRGPADSPERNGEGQDPNLAGLTPESMPLILVREALLGHSRFEEVRGFKA